MPRTPESDRDINRAPLFDDPYEWFDSWFARAEASGISNPNAMALATCGESRQPEVRIVLLKEWDARGFVFYTNLRSMKGRSLQDNPHAALNFFWRELNRQIRIEGPTERVSDDRADAYFATRPRASQIGAWASAQSQPLESRRDLMERTEQLEAKFEGDDVPRPPHWSGIRVLPARIEFWEEGDHRLHNRWEFLRRADEWDIQRLNP